jgi:membrane-associated protease RseP (regulator of RpoE activity)
MVMAVIQKLSGDRVSATAERMVYLTGWVALMAFLAMMTFNDVGRLVG